MSQVRKVKSVLCPLCHSFHDTPEYFWLRPASNEFDEFGTLWAWEGWKTDVWCEIEVVGVVKMYSPNYRYIGYFIAREIPF